MSGSEGPAEPNVRPLNVRELAERHGIRPTKALGQNFLVDPNLARRIVDHADVGPGDRVLEVGAGLGALTVPLARTGAEVLAVEFDRGVVRALREVVSGFENVRVLEADAVRLDWTEHLRGASWRMVSNLPYNVGVPVLMRLLEEAPQIERFVVMVQREVGERLAASPGHEHYGSVSVRVAYHATAKVIRRVPPTVFWPPPKVESVVVEIIRRPPPVATERRALFKVVEEGFAQRRKTMRNALVRLGLDAAHATDVLSGCGIAQQARAEVMSLEQFACVAESIEGVDG